MFEFVPSLGILLAVFVFMFGLIIGSFLNVVVYRYNSGITLGGRSMCFSCGKTLRWYELVPVFSFLIQGAKCRGCKTHISWQYPLVEFSTGLLFLGAFFVAKSYLDLAYLIIQFSLLMVISVYDLRHKIIPNLFSYLFAFLAFVYMCYALWAAGFQWDTAWPDLISGPVCFLPFAAMWYFSKGKWMGFGDAKLALGLGWFLGLGKAYLAILLSFWMGSIAGIFLILLSRSRSAISGSEKITMKSEIPFGPFLILGLLLMTFFDTQILGIVKTFMHF